MYMYGSRYSAGPCAAAAWASRMCCHAVTLPPAFSRFPPTSSGSRSPMPSSAARASVADTRVTFFHSSISERRCWLMGSVWYSHTASSGCQWCTLPTSCLMSAMSSPFTRVMITGRTGTYLGGTGRDAACANIPSSCTIHFWYASSSWCPYSACTEFLLELEGEGPPPAMSPPAMPGGGVDRPPTEAACGSSPPLKDCTCMPLWSGSSPVSSHRLRTFV
mmetsp:Transcript_13359/g.42384  ORF Transcript_13359/g.42384 Transcript_13359/m.42384 type:complete len:219 (-) Transcript_13359:282-938(-)